MQPNDLNRSEEEPTKAKGRNKAQHERERRFAVGRDFDELRGILSSLGCPNEQLKGHPQVLRSAIELLKRFREEGRIASVPSPGPPLPSGPAQPDSFLRLQGRFRINKDLPQEEKVRILPCRVCLPSFWCSSPSGKLREQSVNVTASHSEEISFLLISVLIFLHRATPEATKSPHEAHLHLFLPPMFPFQAKQLGESGAGKRARLG